jgi:hypothetical protein
MRDRLPQELRDMVYRYLWEDKNMQWTVGANLEFKDLERIIRNPCSTERHCQCLETASLPRILQTAYVGAETLVEVVEAMYKCDSQPMRTSYNIVDVPDLVEGDGFHLGISPASLLRRLEIWFDVEKCYERDEELFTSDFDQDELKLDLEPLLSITNKARFDLTIRMRQRYIRLDVIQEYLDAISPICQTFSAEEAKLDITFVYRGREHRKGPVRYPIKYDLLGAALDPEQDWKADMRKWIESVSSTGPRESFEHTELAVVGITHPSQTSP